MVARCGWRSSFTARTGGAVERKHEDADDHALAVALLAQVEQLFRWAQQYDASEVDVSVGGAHVRVRRERPVPLAPAAAPLGVGGATEGVPAGPPSQEWVVVAPIVGVFYRSTTPAEPPFVEEGATVRVGETLGIVESMKIMNEIVAERAGRMVAVLAANGATVEFGQPLFRCTPLTE